MKNGTLVTTMKCEAAARRLFYLGWAAFLAAGPIRAQAAASLQPTLPMKTIVIEEKRYVSAADLEREAGIAVKALPGQKEWVACIEERCALIRDAREENGLALVGVRALAEALNAEVQLDGETSAVRFRFRDGTAPDGEARLGVGQLAPNFKLPRLDGTFISLGEMRGKRVLINSWASW